MSDLIRFGENFPEPSQQPFTVEGGFVTPEEQNALARRTDITAYATPEENLRALLAEPLRDGFRPYADNCKVKGLCRSVFKHTSIRIEDYPTAVPADDGTLQPATLLERVVYEPVEKMGSVYAQSGVVMERAQLPNDDVVATITQGKANLVGGVFFPRQTYLITALGGAMFRDWGWQGLEGEVNRDRPRPLTEEQLGKFATDVRTWLDPEQYQARKPLSNMRMPAVVNDARGLAIHPALRHTDNIEWFRVGRPDKFEWGRPVGDYTTPDD